MKLHTFEVSLICDPFFLLYFQLFWRVDVNRPLPEQPARLLQLKRTLVTLGKCPQNDPAWVRRANWASEELKSWKEMLYLTFAPEAMSFLWPSRKRGLCWASVISPCPVPRKGDETVKWLGYVTGHGKVRRFESFVAKETNRRPNRVIEDPLTFPSNWPDLSGHSEPARSFVPAFIKGKLPEPNFSLWFP